MAKLKRMPPLIFDAAKMKRWGKIWLGTEGSTDKKTGMPTRKKERCFDKKQQMDFTKEIVDRSVAECLAKMLGGIPVKTPEKAKSLLPPADCADCVEIGDTTVVGGIRTQRFDIAYRPDGIRIAYDSKTLNGESSTGKNWNNMINDLASEATTVHTRFPYALALFIVVLPKPVLSERRATTLIRTLERMNLRLGETGEPNKAESIALVVWDPETGEIDDNVPRRDSSLRYEQFLVRVEEIYSARYDCMPPHE